MQSMFTSFYFILKNQHLYTVTMFTSDQGMYKVKNIVERMTKCVIAFGGTCHKGWVRERNAFVKNLGMGLSG